MADCEVCSWARRHAMLRATAFIHYAPSGRSAAYHRCPITSRARLPHFEHRSRCLNRSAGMSPVRAIVAAISMGAPGRARPVRHLRVHGSVSSWRGWIAEGAPGCDPLGLCRLAAFGRRQSREGSGRPRRPCLHLGRRHLGHRLRIPHSRRTGRARGCASHPAWDRVRPIPSVRCWPSRQGIRGGHRPYGSPQRHGSHTGIRQRSRIWRSWHGPADPSVASSRTTLNNVTSSCCAHRRELRYQVTLVGWIGRRDGQAGSRDPVLWRIANASRTIRNHMRSEFATE